MRRVKFGIASAAAFLAVFSLIGRGSADEPGTGFELGARVAYGLPLGDVENQDGADEALNDTISGQIPLWLDLGYRATPQLMVGGYFSYGFGFVGDDLEEACDALDGCSIRDLRLGAQLQFHVTPGGDVDPWLGAGFGYEWLQIGFSQDDTDITVTARGFEFVSLQAGLDLPSGPAGGIGPFLSLSIAQYDHFSSSCDGDCTGYDEQDEDVEDKALHQWLFLGLRGTFVL